MSSDIAVEALEYYVKLLGYQPPGAVTYGIDQCISAVARGQVFSTLTRAAVGKPIFDSALSEAARDGFLGILP